MVYAILLDSASELWVGLKIKTGIGDRNCADAGCNGLLWWTASAQDFTFEPWMTSVVYRAGQPVAITASGTIASFPRSDTKKGICQKAKDGENYAFARRWLGPDYQAPNSAESGEV